MQWMSHVVCAARTYLSTVFFWAPANTIDARFTPICARKMAPLITRFSWWCKREHACHGNPRVRTRLLCSVSRSSSTCCAPATVLQFFRRGSSRRPDLKSSKTSPYQPGSGVTGDLLLGRSHTKFLCPSAESFSRQMR